MDLEKILEFDPLAYAESKGMSHDSALAVALMSNATKNAVLEAHNDTYFGMTPQHFLTLCIMHGFKIVYEERFTYRDRFDNADKQETFYCLWDGTKLITFDTYWGGKSVNGGRCYFSWKPKDGAENRRPLGPCSNGWESHAYGCHFDVREGLFHWLERNAQEGEFIVPHVDCMGPSLLTFADYYAADGRDDTRPYPVRTADWDAKSKARAAKLPKEVLDNLAGAHIK